MPGAGLVGGLSALIADYGVPGIVTLIVLLAIYCTVIWVIARRHHINHANVTDSHEVVVLAAARPEVFEQEPLAEHHDKRVKTKGGAR